MTSCASNIEYLQTLTPSLITDQNDQAIALRHINDAGCCALLVSKQQPCFFSLLNILEGLATGFTMFVLSNGGSVSTGGGGSNGGNVSPPDAFSIADILTGATVTLSSNTTTNITTTGVFCGCYNDTHIKSTPIAQGANDSSTFNAAFYSCLVEGIPATNDHYYSPDGTSAGCELLPGELRPTACIGALTSNITTCGDGN